jgi:integrase/recombinase XerD
MNNAELLDEFSDALWLEDGLSRNTLDSYRRDLNKFADWLEGTRGAALLQTTHGDIQGYLGHLLLEQKAKASSTGRNVSSLKRLFRYLLRQNKISIDPTLQIATPKLPRNLSSCCSTHPTRKRRWDCATAPCWKCCMPRDCACPNWSLCASHK